MAKRLTQREILLLKLLMDRADEVVSREDLPENRGLRRVPHHPHHRQFHRGLPEAFEPNPAPRATSTPSGSATSSPHDFFRSSRQPLDTTVV